MWENAGIILIIVAVVALLGSGVGVTFLVGRRTAPIADSGQRPPTASASTHLDLARCLELSDQAAAAAERLSACLATAALPVEVNASAQQLIGTINSLTGRFSQLAMSANMQPSLPAHRERLMADSAARHHSQLPTTAVLAQAEVDAAQQPRNDPKPPPSPFDDARRFPRASFRGSAKATIYPRHTLPGREPVQCTVLTRDLSCGGIGIAHSEQLFPKQIIVLDAVGKLLVGEVRWCRRVDEHFYVAGCRLVKTHG